MADFEVFAPQGRHVAPIGVKFHPHQCNDKGTGPPKLKFLLKFDQMWNINAPQGRIPGAIFTKFSEFKTRFRCVSC